MPTVDVTVVGAGAAGLFCALTASGAGARVALISRSSLPGSASYWAQGGIAAALAVDDSPGRHARDTLEAGRGAARPSAVQALCEEAPERVRDLERMGVVFDADRRGALALGLEGGHTARRVVHAGGAATGRRITRQLSALAARDERIEVLEGASATAVLALGGRCTGVEVTGEDGAVKEIASRGTVLATGGAAALWARSTNPPGSAGVGLWLAYAAGAALADLELTQFHPTALVAERSHDGFLITEAVRGEGATLLDADGERFVDELAPRDEVALAIEAELRERGGRAVALDMRMVDMARFPNIASTLAELDIDPARQTVPVAPAAHYTMGGVATDIEGRSSVPGLYAVGECACTGLHGANRLASNSLAECFVLGRRAALAATGEPAGAGGGAPQQPTGFDPLALPSPQTRAALWRHAGLRRSAEGLRELAGDPYPPARLIAAAALAREESRGAHQRTDFPGTDPALDSLHVVEDGEGGIRTERWD
jgi:L-aspartate oxidase